MTFDFVKVTIKSRFCVGSTINFVHYVNNFDIFHLKDTYMNVCTKEVKEAIEKENISNITFEPCYGIPEKC